MDLNQKKNENHVLYPSDYSISDGQIDTLRSDEQKQQNKRSSWSNQVPTKRKWLWIGCIATVVVILVISLANSQFGSLVGYPVLISTIASILACLSSMAITEFLDDPKKQKK